MRAFCQMRMLWRSGKHLSEKDQMSVNQIEPILQHFQEPGEEKIVIIKHPIKESHLHAATISTTDAYLAKYIYTHTLQKLALWMLAQKFIYLFDPHKTFYSAAAGHWSRTLCRINSLVGFIFQSKHMGLFWNICNICFHCLRFKTYIKNPVQNSLWDHK